MSDDALDRSADDIYEGIAKVIAGALGARGT